MTTAAEAEINLQEQAAAGNGPFPHIEEYAFLSDCHTGALVAPDGSIDWLCVPSFDSPSIFSSLLDRQAGHFRFGPYGVTVPVGRVYEPGTHTLITGWRTPGGWLVVREALVIGRREGEDTITRHTRPPADDDAEHMLVRTVECIEGAVEIEVVCEPAFAYGSVPARWEHAGDGGCTVDASGGGQFGRRRVYADPAFEWKEHGDRLS